MCRAMNLVAIALQLTSVSSLLPGCNLLVCCCDLLLVLALDYGLTVCSPTYRNLIRRELERSAKGLLFLPDSGLLPSDPGNVSACS